MRIEKFKNELRLASVKVINRLKQENYKSTYQEKSMVYTCQSKQSRLRSFQQLKR